MSKPKLVVDNVVKKKSKVKRKKSTVRTIKTMKDVHKFLKKNSMYYFASPYSHKSPLVQDRRYMAAIGACAKLIQEGYLVLEPIGSCHEKSLLFQLPGGYQYWQKRDRLMIKKSDGIVILKIDGWDTSVGVTDEISYAKRLGKPVVFIEKDAILSKDELAGL